MRSAQLHEGPDRALQTVKIHQTLRTSSMGSSLSHPPTQSLQLADGRRLAWYEYGHPDGVPCLYTTGTPASGITGVIYDGVARTAGVRFISLDKPGYGHSDFLPDRRLTDWPRDVATLADHLGLSRFAVMGESGGGPHALALAWGLAERVSLVLCASGMGPGTEPWVRDGMKPMNRRVFWLARHAPWLLDFAMRSMLRTLRDPKRRDRWIQQQLDAAPACDRDVLQREPALLQLTLDAALDAFREGPRGATQEMQIFARPWGFALSEVPATVHVWHGTEDVNVPFAIAERVCRELPDARPHFIEGGGHVLAFEHGADMMKVIVEA